MKILVTGAAGFIGFHLTKRLISEGIDVVGLDNINDYYDPSLKIDRLRVLGLDASELAFNQALRSKQYQNYKFIKLHLEDQKELFQLFEREQFTHVCNLAAQAGVRYSIENPYAYIDSNIVGFINILEACRHHQIEHLAYASSSSVYGLNEKMPFSTRDNVDHPISLYAATKKSNELMAHTYSHLYAIPTTGLRFFTVYGPWGRPDMALFKFTKAILADEAIDVYNQGNMERDFTYIDDIVEGVYRVLIHPAEGNSEWTGAHPVPGEAKSPFKVYNIGNSSPVGLMDFIHEIEKNLDKEAQKNFMPLQEGDVPKTWADVSDLERNLNYKPSTSIQKGVKEFIDWYLKYYQS